MSRPSESPSAVLAARAAAEALAELRAGYATELPERVERLAHALHAWHRAPADATRLELARVLAHKLRGTAGSYGFPEVGEAAGRVEEAVKRAGGTSDDQETAVWSEVLASLREAEELATEARARAGSPMSHDGRVLR